ncbi:MAG TPA: hypothetical protein VL769_06875 [Acidimicrobiia bacterium]|nr:hypothetical protein [Acidimicrobiia bacterium]
MAAAVTVRRAAALIVAGLSVAGCIQGSDKGSKRGVPSDAPTTVSSTVAKPGVTSTAPPPVVTSKVSTAVVAGDVRLLLPIADYGEAAWLTSDTFVIERHRITEGPVIFELWAGRPDGTNFRKLNLRTGPQCRLDDVHRPYRLPGGRLGAIRQCSPKTADSPLVHVNTLVAVNLGTGGLTTLASQGDEVVTDVAWDPGMRTAIASSTSNCGTLVTLTPSGTAPLDLRVGPSRHTWNTADQETAAPTDGACDPEYGTVGGVTGAPGNRRIAFHASASRRAPGVVSVWDRRTNKVTNIVDDVAGVAGIAWSPTGRWIAFVGNPGGRGDGLWLVNPTGQHLTRIAARHHLESVSWSPDGRHLIYLGVAGDLPGSRAFSDIAVHRVDLALDAA